MAFYTIEVDPTTGLLKAVTVGQNLANLLTTQGDIIFRGASVAERRAKGTLNQYLKQGADEPVWGGLNIVEDTTPQLGGPLDMNEKSIDLTETLDADGKYCGITCQGVYGATLAFGDLIYLAVADQRWELADADAEATAGDVMLGIALESGSDGDSKLVLLWGYIREDDWAWTPADALYVSTTAGDMTHTRPSGTGDIVRVVGYAHDDADTIFFCPSPVWLEIT